MYESQAQLEALAQQAKKQLEMQAKGQDIYAGVLDDENDNETAIAQNSVTEHEESHQESHSQDTQEKEDEYSTDEYFDRIEKPAPQLDAYDDVLFPGGPTKSQIELWKKEWDGYDIYVTEILNETFIFRTLNRFEYKQLISFVDVNALQREETICETVTLWPAGYNYESMATQKAGIPSTYSEIIMEKSGFTKDIAIQEI